MILHWNHNMDYSIRWSALERAAQAVLAQKAQVS
jgi:hypothetical protein